MESNSRRSVLRWCPLALVVTVSLMVVGCSGGGNGGEGGGRAPGSRKPLAEASVLAGNSDPVTVAVHYISMRNSTGAAVASEGNAQAMIAHMTTVWAQCNIGFQLDRYEAVDPSALGAQFNPANYSELDQMRMRAQNEQSVVMIGTGAWNRAGDLGSSGSNCFSSFPGDYADGIVCEAATATAPLINSHEIGHWLNLIHTDDPNIDSVADTIWNNAGTNLMNHFVAPANKFLTSGQCARARSSIGNSRRNAVI